MTQEAKRHAQTVFPGAEVPKATRNVPGGIDETRAEYVAKFMRDPTVIEEVEGSFKNGSKGVKYRLKVPGMLCFDDLVKQRLIPRLLTL